ncbi:FHA domain-containing protein [Solwaraspora sp. WMMD1047]|uniref:FHA domain-containing protein n=1 Tax=Solwaraspora sp. WMMD1047 TaxID=3016102 RepID=UPI002415BE4A|nr:FHA domain-containing protein [Solwaraspora sp. WMMD1047]MDG4828818.1 FHA domain-containing protein [Solwaraspora sp. WMMD1047]
MGNEHDLSPVLTVVSGPVHGVSFRLGPELRVIGRDASADFVIDDRKISRKHATVEIVDGRVMLADAGSTNGTWLNGERITDARALRDGDRIRIGNVGLRFFDPAAAATDPIGTLHYVPAPTDQVPARPNDGADRWSGRGVGRPEHGTTRPARNGAALRSVGGPTMTLDEVMPDTTRSGRTVLTVAGVLAMVAWFAWAYLIW